MAKKRVFISFDYDHDLDIKNNLVAQSKHPESPFSIKDCSIQEEVSEKWKEEARKRIKSCDVVVVLCGKTTDSAKGVTAELTITREEKIPYFLLAGHGKQSIAPKGALASDEMYKWSWKKLSVLLNGKQ